MEYKLPPLPANLPNVVRRIRACEGEIAAQVVFEHALNKHAIAAMEAQGVPDGWQLVPKEPTQEMCAADFDCEDSIGIDSARTCYKAMLASAPPAPQSDRTALEQYDLDQSPDYRKGWDDGRMKGYEVGVRHGKEQHLFSQASVV